jgi:hypothetical protein
MNSDTAELIRALGAIDRHLPRMVNDVRLGLMTADRQHEFADLLIELGELLHRDASAEQADQTGASGDIPARDRQPPGSAPQISDREEELA